MKKRLLYNWINCFIALVWLINGLFCKAFNLVPRHQQIVERILNIADARSMTLFIGFAEIAMAVWILGGFRSRLNAKLQILIIALMNLLEFFLASDLLLWGKANAIFALLFILLIYYKEFYFINRIDKRTTCYHS